MVWVELSWIESNWIELNWVEFCWIELNWVELSWIELSWIELNWVELRVDQYQPYISIGHITDQFLSWIILFVLNIQFLTFFLKSELAGWDKKKVFIQLSRDNLFCTKIKFGNKVHRSEIPVCFCSQHNTKIRLWESNRAGCIRG